MIHKRKKGKKGYQWATWRHKQTKTRTGEVKLIQKDGVFWGEINDRSGGYMLAESFLSWIMSNADDLVCRVDFWRP